ncbi:MAG: creatininase family protein [Rhodospirillaceae bacterium]|nr:creatininase family protein [Rhodospirillaceae bacterium]
MFVSFAQQTQTAAARDGAVAILPLGAVETHGPHLPLGTDGIIAEGILDHVARQDGSATPFVRLPLLWCGASSEHAGRAGTLSMTPEQLIAQIEGIGEGLARCGIQRVVLFNGHGGNIAPASLAALKLRTRFNMLAASAHWLDFGLPEGLVPPSAPVADVHGGWIETSVLMHMAPQLVVRGAIAARAAAPPAPSLFPPSLFPNGPIAWGWKLDDLAPRDGLGGWIGRPDLATAAQGEMLLDHAGAKLLGLLHELAAAEWPR